MQLIWIKFIRCRKYFDDIVFSIRYRYFAITTFMQKYHMILSVPYDTGTYRYTYTFFEGSSQPYIIKISIESYGTDTVLSYIFFGDDDNHLRFHYHTFIFSQN